MTRNGERIPIHGGPGTLGVFNAINVSWVGKDGYTNVPTAPATSRPSSSRGGCPNARTILTYSQSANPRSPYYADQTRMFSRREWNPMRFCAREILADPELTVRRFGCPGPLALRSAQPRAAAGGCA